MIEIKVINVDNKGVIPKYAHEGDAGFDLSSAEEIILYPNEPLVVPTNLRMDIPEGYELQIRPRSGLAAKKGITVLNSPGTIDSGFTNQIGVILINLSNEVKTFEKGTRIAQGVLNKFEKAIFKEVKNDSEFRKSTRGLSGFGSTGTN
jgi:dUTP pyrophosphatase